MQPPNNQTTQTPILKIPKPSSKITENTPTTKQLSQANKASKQNNQHLKQSNEHTQVKQIKSLGNKPITSKLKPV